MNGLIYMLEVVLCSALFVALYKALFEGRIPHRAARAYIVGSMFVAAAVPALEIPLYPAAGMSRVEAAIYRMPVRLPSPESVAADNIAAQETASGAGHDGSAPETLPMVLAVVYMMGVALNMVLFGRRLRHIGGLRRRAVRTDCGGYTLAVSDEVGTPFAFGRTVFVNSEFDSRDRDLLLAHECSHVRHGHTAERLALETLRCLFWINPFVWMASRLLAEVQEYEADGDVLASGYGVDEYRMLIFRQLFGYNPDIACGLKGQTIKKRFVMMTSFNGGRASLLRLGAVLPLTAAMVLVFGCVRAGTGAEALPQNEYEVVDFVLDGTVKSASDALNSVVGTFPKFAFWDDGTVEITADEAWGYFRSGWYDYTFDGGVLKLSGTVDYTLPCKVRREADGTTALHISVSDAAVSEITLRPAADADTSTGDMVCRRWEGLLPAASCPGIRYELTLHSREHSGDGTFRLVMTYLEAEDGKDMSYAYTGRRYTLRGMAGDENATVWQLVADNGNTFNFQFEREKNALTLLNNKLERPQTKLNYTLTAVE